MNYMKIQKISKSDIKISNKCIYEHITLYNINTIIVYIYIYMNKLIFNFVYKSLYNFILYGIF